jgi:Ca2+-transporting ATPase
VGFIGLADPLRADVPEAITIAHRAGVRVVMITGDGPVTARAIADQAGLPPGPVLCGSELTARAGGAVGETSGARGARRAQGAGGSTGASGAGVARGVGVETGAGVARGSGVADGAHVADGADGASGADGDLMAAVAAVSVFARVLPQQKLELVRALQASGAVVAMTGDGVNDAAALKAADIGVAMGRRGTAVARESADLVLLNDRFSDLVAALALGRRVETNLQRALAYTLAIHIPIALLALVPLLLPGFGLILLPVHIALLHLVIDPACTVVFEALEGDPQLMRRPPRAPEAPLFAPRTWRRALLQGAALAVAALLLLFWPGHDSETRRSLVFSLLVLAGGGLVWVNGAGQHRITAAGPLLGVALWLLVLLVAPLRHGLALASLTLPSLLLLAVVTALALLAAALAGRVQA